MSDVISLAEIRAAKILVVDDQAANVALLGYMLDAAGYSNVTSTLDSREVQALHRQHQFDIIVLDLNMPHLNGFQVLQQLRAVEVGGYLPVLVVTAEPAHKITALEAGARDFVSKPFDNIEVLTRIRNLLEVRLLHRQLQDFNVALEGEVGLRTRQLQDSLLQIQTTQERLQGLQNELQHLSRVSVMGELAATLAHELNQPLTAMVSTMNGCRRLLQGLDFAEAAALRDAVQRAADQALRAGLIIRRLRDFVARRESRRRRESLPALIEDAVALATVGRRQPGPVIRSQLATDADGVMVDRIQIQQVLINLLRNAVDAMAARPIEAVTIASRRIDAEVIEVSVSDSGPGIDPKIADRLFQPFVTGKSDGMGLGLSISRGIVETHGGRLWVESNPVGGATFRLTLPAAPPGMHGDVV